jgi:hypothetical protein
MTQISRPFQIALLALVVLAGVWFFALQGHSTSSSSSPSASAPTPSSPSADSEEKAAGAQTPIYKGAAPGVEGLSRAIANAHKAVATSQQNAQQLQEKSAQAGTVNGTSAPGQSTPAVAPASTPTATVIVHKVKVPPVNRHAAATHGATVVKVASPGAKAPGVKAAANAAPKMQVIVENELKQGKLVAVLFWNPKATVDMAVHTELQTVGRSLGGKIAIHSAQADQVGSFGAITHSIQIYQTPTILLVDKNGQATTLTGLTDTFSLNQAIEELQHP